MNNVKAFEVGKTYRAFCPNAYYSVIQMTVTARTAKTVSFMWLGHPVTKRITVRNNSESTRLNGSMAPIWSADRDEHGNIVA